MSARGGKPRADQAGLPVDVARLRSEFPDLTDVDIDAYVQVTRRVLGDATARAKAMREVMERAREARQKEAAGAALGSEERLLVRYLAAIAKMQRSTVRPS